MRGQMTFVDAPVNLNLWRLHHATHRGVRQQGSMEESASHAAPLRSRRDIKGSRIKGDVKARG